MELVEKVISINVELDLKDFLTGRFSLDKVNNDLLKKDLGVAVGYCNAFLKMKDGARDFGESFSFYPIESCRVGDVMIVDEVGVVKRRMIGFDEIRDFSKYVVEEYGV